MTTKKTTSEICSKDHDLLIRIDEQIKLLLQRLTTVEISLSDNKNLYENLNLRTTKLEKDVYGDKFVDGIVAKVEKHDKIIIKSVAIFGFIVAICDYLFKWIIMK